MKNIYSFIALFICISSQLTFAQDDANLMISLSAFPKVIKQNNTESITVNFNTVDKDFNQAITLNFAIDGELVASKNIALNLLKNTTESYKLSYNFNLKASEHQLKVWITRDSEINKSINIIETNFLVARTTVPQLPLIEEFTSNTCGPCATFNTTFDPFLASQNTNKNGAKVAAVKYQMNWPSPGNDPSYNSDGNGRKNSYVVGGIPKSYLNGMLTSTFNQAVIDGASGDAAFAVEPYFYMSGDTVKATCHATSYTTMTGTLRLHLALTEDFYTYSGGTTSQTTFHYVERKMLPNYVGTVLNNIHEDTTYTSKRDYKVTYGNVTQNTYNIWSTSAGITLVAWIQNTSTKEVFQAGFANTPSALNTNDNIQQSNLVVYPNPTNESFTIKLELNESAEVSYTLTDLAGKIIEQPIIQQLPAGKHLLQSSTQSLAPGIYLCKIKANNNNFVERIVVTK